MTLLLLMNYQTTNTCGICLEEINISDISIESQLWRCSECKGILHLDCINNWKSRTPYEYSCPICRKKYPLDIVTINKGCYNFNLVRIFFCICYGTYVIIGIVLYTHVLYLINIYITNKNH